MTEYLRLVVSSWWFWIGCITGLLRLGEWISAKQIPYLTPAAKLSLIGLLFVLAQYSAYSTRTTQLATATSELNTIKANTPFDLTRPFFRAEFATISFGPTYVMVDLVLINSGAPSIAYNWAIAVAFADGQPIAFPLVVIPDKALGARLQFDNSAREFNLANDLTRLGSEPIRTGDYIKGILIGENLAVSPDDEAKRGSRTVIVSVADSHVKQYSFRWSEKKKLEQGKG